MLACNFHVPLRCWPCHIVLCLSVWTLFLLDAFSIVRAFARPPLPLLQPQQILLKAIESLFKMHPNTIGKEQRKNSLEKTLFSGLWGHFLGWNCKFVCLGILIIITLHVKQFKPRSSFEAVVAALCYHSALSSLSLAPHLIIQALWRLWSISLKIE